MDWQKLKVLVVDDSRIMRRIVSQKLRSLGVRDFVEASNGRQGLKELEKGGISLVVSDWSMPGMSGMDLLSAVRQHELYSATPFILLTAEAQLYNILMAYRQNVDQYVTKPFTAEYFEYAIRRVVRDKYGFS